MARSTGWWTCVRHEFTERRFQAGQLPLGPLAVLGVSNAHQIPHPNNLADDAYLLDREFAYWQRLCSVGRVRIRPSTMARTVFTATLTRPLPYRQAVGVLERVGVPSAEEPANTVLADHGCCYPPVDADTVLEPLYPDRLAEDSSR